MCIFFVIEKYHTNVSCHSPLPHTEEEILTHLTGKYFIIITKSKKSAINSDYDVDLPRIANTLYLMDNVLKAETCTITFYTRILET